MKFSPFLAFATAAIGAPAFAAPSTCLIQTAAGNSTVVCTATSDQGKAMTLTFPGNSVTMATDTATFCSVPGAEIDSAALWMNMGGRSHPSGETTLTNEANGCTTIADIEFVMPGTWQVKIGFSDADQNPGNNDKGLFEVNVAH